MEPERRRSAATVAILAAGQGTRMRSPVPKVLQPLCGRPMLAYVVEQALLLDPERVLVVVGPSTELGGLDAIRAAVEADPAVAAAGKDRIGWVVQPEQRGTGDALACCSGELDRPGATGPVVVLYGDMPLLRAASLERLLGAFDETGGRGCALLTAAPEDPRGFGRVVRRGGAVAEIVEERDASPEVLAVVEVNLGVYAFAREMLREELPRLSTDNAQGELYLTDVVGACVERGLGAEAVVLSDPVEAIGVNTLAHLAEARHSLQERILAEHMERGVWIEDPSTTYVDHGVEIGPRTKLLPCTVIRAGVRIGEGCEVGPFTQLRVGTVLEDGAEVGNFTECKNARIGPGTKAKHLSYLGDVTVGGGANIGAGTIVANYDGQKKHPSTIGDRAFVGSGSVLIAPVDVGEGALTGGGAVVTRGSVVPPGEAWVGVPARPLRRASEEKGGTDAGASK